jgi:preprotein translocase subunit SecA
VSLQNYFRMYSKLAGMTGTAETEAEEFKSIYGMDVVVVPTNQDIVRKDSPDVVYKTRRAKYGAIVKEVRERFEAGQPTLLGTKSIEQNEVMSRYLKRMKVPHELLNAKNHENEAMILAGAGKPGAVTVATNIAGRGVDIVLGGPPPEKPGKKATKKDLEAYEKAKAQWQAQHEAVKDAGGLHVLGTDRHDSRRIDNQLRGRSGRQGDPGSSRFYVSLEDDLMRIFGGEQVSKIMDMLKIPEDQPIESGMVSKSIESAQSKVEGFHFDQRKRVVDYDDVMNKQREIIYKRRQAILDAGEDEEQGTKIKEKLLGLVEGEIQSIVIARSGEGFSEEEYNAILKEFLTIIPFDKGSQERIAEKISKLTSPEAIVSELQTIARKTYEDREGHMGLTNMRQLERFVMLSSIDRKWMDHLDAMDDLREGIWLRGGKDQVLSEYKREAFDMFERLLGLVDSEAAHTIFRIGVANMARPVVAEEDMVTGKDEDFAAAPSSQRTPKKAASSNQGLGALAAAMSQTSNRQGSGDGRNPIMVEVKSGQPKVGRNDPCPCGSGNSK